MIKKLICGFMAVIFLLPAFLSDKASAAMAINSLEDFLLFRDRVNDGEYLYANLCADIDLSSVCGPSVGSWTPVGIKDGATIRYFSGGFNGNGHTISGLYINSESSDITGLFANCGGGSSISNLTVEGEITAAAAGGIAGTSNGKIENCVSRVNVNCSKLAAGICAYNYVGTIVGCKNYGAVESESGAAGILGEGYSAVSRCVNYAKVTGAARAGGIAAYITKKTDTNVMRDNVNLGLVGGNGSVGGLFGICCADIENSYNFAQVQAEGKNVGGIIGDSRGTVTGCRNYAKVTGAVNVGGIAGTVSGEILNSANAADITGNSSTGGIAGRAEANISNCENSGGIFGGQYAGGIVGSTKGALITVCENNGRVKGTSQRVGGIIGDAIDTDCSLSVNTGEVVGEGNFTGGLVAVLMGGSLTDSYNTGKVTGVANVAGGAAFNKGAIKNIFSYTAEPTIICAINSDGSSIENAFEISEEYPVESFADKTVLTLLDEQYWVQGAKHPVLICHEKSGVKTAEELIAALEGEEETVNVAGDIVLDEKIVLTRDVKINGNFHLILSMDEIIDTNGHELTVENLRMQTSADCAIKLNNSYLTLLGLTAVYSDEGFGVIQYGGKLYDSEAVTVMIPGSSAFLYNTDCSSAALIEVGDYLEAGTVLGSKILWRCVDIDENGPLMFADKIIAVRCYDAGGDHGENTWRNHMGSNVWALSNLRSWLNSNEEHVTWLCGNPPDREHVWQGTDEENPFGYNPYDDDKGFLTGFEDYELEAVKMVRQKCVVNKSVDPDRVTVGENEWTYSTDFDTCLNDYDTAYGEMVEDKFFPPDNRQVMAIYKNLDKLGEDFLIGQMSDAAKADSEYTSDLAAYWTRTPVTAATNGNDMLLVSHSGKDFYAGKAYSGRVGVRPGFYLNEEVNLSGRGSETEPYTIYDESANENKITVTEAVKRADGIEVKAQISVSGEIPRFAAVVSVYYKDKRMIACRKFELDNIHEAQTIEEKIECNPDEAAEVKVFLWRSMKSIQPLCAPARHEF